MRRAPRVSSCLQGSERILEEIQAGTLGEVPSFLPWIAIWICNLYHWEKKCREDVWGMMKVVVNGAEELAKRKTVLVLLAKTTTELKGGVSLFKSHHSKESSYISCCILWVMILLPPHSSTRLHLSLIFIIRFQCSILSVMRQSEMRTRGKWESCAWEGSERPYKVGEIALCGG